MNGTAFYPSTIERTVKKIGQLFVMANGSKRFLYRNTKNEWVLSWTTVPESALANIRAIHNLLTSFAYIDEFGVSRTVICTDDDYSETLDAAKININGTFYYDVSITLQEI